MRKGQAALEFLMTYGWAILVVLAAIAALAYFGVLSPDRFLPAKCTVSGGFSCGEYKISTAGNVQVNIQNNLGVDADIVNVTVTSADCGGIATGVQTFANIRNGDKTGLTTFACTGTMGSKFKGDIIVEYIRAGETVSHNAGGTISGTAE